MEKNMKVLCPECGDQEVFKIGTSFLDSKYNLLNLKSDHCIIHFIEEEKDKEKIKSIIKHGGEIANHYGYTLYYCNNCHYLYSKFSFRVGIGKEQYDSINHDCMELRKMLTSIPKTTTKKVRSD